MSRILKLYGNCVPVRGATRSVICDLQFQRARLIPEALYVILTEFVDQPLDTIKANFGHKHDAVIDEYASALIRENYAFWTNDPLSFPAVELSWDSPALFTNAIIDVDKTSQHNFYELFREFDSVGCQAVQVRIYDPLTLSQLETIVLASEGSRCRHLELYIHDDPSLSDAYLEQLCNDHHIIARVTIFASVADRVLRLQPLPVTVSFVKDLVNINSCGQIGPRYFNSSMDHFLEAQNFNTCLNRKISICTNGELRSCPAMPGVVGNAGVTPLASLAGHPTLIQIGSITKDKTSGCNACEFRYICTDCRAFIVDPNDLYSKPAKCSYDPYTGNWEGRQ